MTVTTTSIETELSQSPGHKLLFAASDGDLILVKTILEKHPEIDIGFCDEEGRTSLFFAAANGHLAVVEHLLLQGHPWNILDHHGLTAAEFTEAGGHTKIYERIISEGVRAEMIFATLRNAGMECIMGQEGNPHTDTNAAYLSQKLTYDESTESLLDAEGNGVMMGWERPLMLEHTKWLCPRPGLKVLNVGFGLGIIDGMIHDSRPAEHHVIEAHPDVIAYAANHPLRQYITLHNDDWRQVIPSLIQQGHTFDAIFFDTYAEYYDDLRAFSEHVPDLLLPEGVYSYFNGCGGTNKVFNEVYRRIAEMHLEELGMQVAWKPMDVSQLGDDAWQAVRTKYFTLDTYMLPVCTYASIQ